jgi:8-oxo-dGTP diphosphatase
MSESFKKLIRAAGGLVFRESGGERQIALVHRPKYDDWALPKGKLKPGEGWRDAAKREVEEELWSSVVVGKFVGSLQYRVAGVEKLVLYWRMRLVEQHEFIPNEEIDAYVWISRSEALAKLSYPGERDLVEKNWVDFSNR